MRIQNFISFLFLKVRELIHLLQSELVPILNQIISMSDRDSMRWIFPFKVCSICKKYWSHDQSQRRSTESRNLSQSQGWKWQIRLSNYKSDYFCSYDKTNAKFIDKNLASLRFNRSKRSNPR